MFSLTPATVLIPKTSGEDRFGNPVPGEPERAPAMVLVAPGESADLEASRPAGVTVALTLHFTREWTRSLRGCSVELPEPWAGTYRVIGDPKPYDPALCPGDLWLPAEVEAVDG